MMDLNALINVLKVVVNAVAGIPANLAQQDDSSIYFPQIGSGAITDGAGHNIGSGAGTNPQARATIQILSVAGWGFDEWRRTYDPDAVIPGDTYSGPGAPLGGIIYEVKGTRAVTVQFMVECFDQTGAGAHVFLEQIRTRIGLPSIEETLNAAGFAYQTIKASHTADYDDENGRRVDVALFEMVFNAFDTATDDPVTTIETVDLTGVTIAIAS